MVQFAAKRWFKSHAADVLREMNAFLAGLA
jgi:hypothetical protein